MVHKALQRWRFPGDARLEPLLRTQARMEGLLEGALVERAVQEAENLLRRFQRQPLYAEMDAALERHHELPYIESAAEWGFMDCLYRTPQGWVLVDFKTDELRSPQAVDAAVEKYRPQLLRYRQAAEQLLGQAPRTRMCFLKVGKQVEVREV
jgi:ATP-dependent exoDNAse (exonuclease V) beta subunit